MLCIFGILNIKNKNACILLFGEFFYVESWNGVHMFTDSVSHNSDDTCISICMCNDQPNIHDKYHHRFGSCYVSTVHP